MRKYYLLQLNHAVPRARDEILVTESPDSTRALISQNSTVEPPAPTTTEIAFEDLDNEEDTKVEELIRNDQKVPENVTNKETIIELEVGDAVSIISESTSHTSSAASFHESEAPSIEENRTSIVKTSRYSRKEFYSRRSARPIDSDTDATGQRPTRPLDTDTNATGQKPSHAATKCDLVRLVHPLELAIVNEDEGDNVCDTQMKVHKLKHKKTRKHKQETRLEGLKSVGVKMTHFENEFDENIPLLSMEAANTDIATSTAQLEKKKIDFPLTPFEGL